MGDKIANLIKAHDEAVNAAIRWNEAIVKGHKTERPHARYEAAERRFDVALTKLQDDIVKKPSKYT